jgi:hypothetical protein
MGSVWSLVGALVNLVPKSSWLFVCAAAVFLSGSVAVARAADECRPPTAQEKRALDKLSTALTKTVESSLVAQDWQVDSRGTAFDALLTVASKPAPRPIFVCSGEFKLQLSLDPSKGRGKDLAEQAERYSKEGTTEGASKMFHAVALGKLEIRTNSNGMYLGQQLHYVTRLSVGGVPLAYRLTTPPSNAGDDPSVETVLCFGDWSRFTSDRYVPYPFAHAAGAPYIENACVQIKGLPETVDPILKSIDWQPLNDALTK